MNISDAKKLYAEMKGIKPYDTSIFQKAWEEEVMALCKELTGKKKKDFYSAYSHLVKEGFEERVKEEFKKHEVAYKEHKQKLDEKKNEIKSRLEEFAKTYKPKKTLTKQLITSRSGGDYHTQGFGANKYAKSALQEDFLFLDLFGFKPSIIEAKVVESGGHYSQRYITYELWANIDEFNFYMLKASGKFISVLNWAVICWKNGTNPKVYFPFIHESDYEKSQVLAYHCDYEITADNMSEEPTWEQIDKMRRK